MEHRVAHPEQLALPCAQNDLKFMLLLGNTSRLRRRSPPKLTSLSDNRSTPVERSLDPSWCWFSVSQGQQTHPITHGDRQDLRCPVLLSFQLVGDVFLFVSPKLQRCSGSLSYGRCPCSLLVVLLCIQHGGIFFGRCLLSILVFSLAFTSAEAHEFTSLADVNVVNKWTFECSELCNR